MAKITETKEINISDCVIGKSQARSRDVGKDVDELAESIRKQGLLQPICVCPSKDSPGSYEVLIGQRRLAAHQLLGKSTITASIFDEYVGETEAKVISLTENMVRTDMSTKDCIDVCTWLYNKYGSMSAVSEETGLSQAKVKNYVKGTRLKPALMELVKENGMDIALALKAQDAVEATGGYDEERAVALANQLSSMSGVQRNKVTEIVKDDPNRPLDEIVEEAKQAEDLYKLNLNLLPKQRKQLESFKEAEKTNMGDAALKLIIEGLNERGFAEDED